MAIRLIKPESGFECELFDTKVRLKLLSGKEKLWIGLELRRISDAYGRDTREDILAFQDALAELLAPYVLSIAGFAESEILDVLKYSDQAGLILGIQEKLIKGSQLSEDETKNSDCSSGAPQANSASDVTTVTDAPAFQS